MATTTHVSTPASGAVAIFELITLLTAAGWTVPAWSDGTTLSGPPTPPASNPYGSGASGSGNLGNNSAWFRIAAPDASREWLVQVVNAAATPPTLVINRSKAGFVTGGTATVLPTATDATALFSSAAAFATIPGRLFISADDADGYGWRLMCLPSGGGNVLTLLADVPLDSPDPADTDPYLWVGYYNATGWGSTRQQLQQRYRLWSCLQAIRRGLAATSAPHLRRSRHVGRMWRRPKARRAARCLAVGTTCRCRSP
jgi:hypothetical protein